MMDWFKPFDSIEENADKIRRHRYGVLTVSNCKLVDIRFRPWPKLISSMEVAWFGKWNHTSSKQAACRIYYNQPLSHSNYLSLSYIEAAANSGYGNLYRAMSYLDLIAYYKRSDAILCEISNIRISDRLMRRGGWERHLENSRRRHWIKRFYGDYSAVEMLPKAPLKNAA
ncbi:MAG: hypothetical protein R3C03_04620 [Pirellulaceae bacterium]